MKIRKKPAESGTFYTDFTNLLGSAETITTINSVVHTPSGLTITDIAVNVVIINGTIQVGKAVQFTLSGGLDGYEYVITIKITSNLGNIIESDVVLLVTDATLIPIDYYGNILRASQYFKNRLDTTAWDSAINPKQRIALFEATQLIDKLNFSGDKAESSQLLEFPRGTDIEVPRNIEFANYEIAYSLLDGVDVDQEIKRLMRSSDGYASVRTTYDRTVIPEYLMAGIPSPKAWMLLKPYLRETRLVKLSRVN